VDFPQPMDEPAGPAGSRRGARGRACPNSAQALRLETQHPGRSVPSVLKCSNPAPAPPGPTRMARNASSLPFPGSRSPRRGGVLVMLLVVFAVLAAVLLLWISSQGERRPEAPTAAESSPADLAIRERVAALFSLHAVQDKPGMLEQAQEALAPLLDRPEPANDDLIAAAILARGRDRGGDKDAEVKGHLARVLARDGHEPRSHYLLARLDMLEGNLPSAEVHLRKVLAREPTDLPTQLTLAQTLEERDPKQAEELYRAVLARGVDNAGSWYVTAVFRLSVLMRDGGRDEDFQRYQEEYEKLLDNGLTAPKEVDFDRGNLANLMAPRPVPSDVPVEVQAPSVAGVETILPQLAGFEQLTPCDLDGNGTTDLAAWGARGLALALQLPDRGWRVLALDASPVAWLVTADLSPLPGSGSAPPSGLDLLAARGGELDWWRVAFDVGGAASWTRGEKPLLSLPTPPLDGVAFDFDHEGDLDLALVGNFGLRLLRNDGARANVPGGGFTDVTQSCGAPLGRQLSWILCEDFDTDQDVDLLCGQSRDVLMLSNLRGGRFESVANERLMRFSATGVRPLCADLDLDSRPDLWGAGPYSLSYFNSASGQFRAEPTRRLARGADSRLAPDSGTEAWTGTPPARLLSADFDGDGLLDAAWKNLDAPAEEVLSAQLAVGRLGQRGFDLVLAPAKTGTEPAIADLDRDGVPEILLADQKGVRVTRLAPPAAATRVELSLRGKKDNRRGVGAVVEARAEGAYRRLYWRGENTSLGLGGAGSLEWLRVTWPNGVVQYELDPAPGVRVAPGIHVIEQVEGLIGSCPFLYTWDGTRYVFVSDVLGITPLGLPMAPGMLVPPDHDEFVLVRGEQLAPKDGFYDLQITEELREVTYLDRVRLDVIDHPSETEIYPNERFTFPPFPLPHVHTLRAPLSPTRATGSDGRDWTEELAGIDDRYASPAAPASSQMLGLCAPHFVELEFDPARLKSAAHLRLFLTGWFYWTDASVNMASAHDPEHEFIPPIFQVPDGQGGWRDAGPPVGFPAGKTKTMVVDVGSLLLRDDPRLRVFTSLRLYWDAIRLAVDDDDAPLVVTPIEAHSAELWRRGFSELVEDKRPEQPARFQWDQVAQRPRWNPHPGIYTKYGGVLPLLSGIDDQFVILGSGDALQVRFDASKAPPLPAGWRRDFLLYLDGWAKDRDHNTVEALHVEPLPFHGMSGYPYGADEHYPLTPATREWLRKFQTRPAESWIPRGG
jgi:hypothetical protein